jgi:hypothetical protein
LLTDLDGLSFNVSMNPQSRAVDGDFSIKLKSRSSWTAQRLFEKAGEAGPAPAIFWRAPADSDAAFFTRAYDPQAYTAIRQSGGDLLEGLMSSVTFPTAERKAARGLWDQLFAAAPMMLTTQGHIDPPAAKSTDPVEQIRAMAISSLGWQMYGIEESPKRVLDFLNDLAALYNKPAVRNWIIKESGLDKRLLPTAKVGPFGKDKAARALEITLTVPADMMGAVQGGGAKPKAPAPFSFWIVVQPDGARTWVAASADKAAIEKHLAMAKTGGAESGTIASRPGLDVFKNGRTVGGGFLTAAGASSIASGGLLSMIERQRYGRGMSEQVTAAVARMPNRGQTPIIIETIAQSGSPSEFVVKAHVTKGTIEDISAFIAGLGAPGRRP